MAYSNILPDPSNPVKDSGKADTLGTNSAPGFASMSISSESKTISNRTNSGRFISVSSGGHKWSFSMTYNPLTREDFEPVFNFLLQQKGKLSPFFVSLPQNKLPRNATFANTVSPSPGLNKTMKTFGEPVQRSELVKGKEYKITNTGSNASSYWQAAGAVTGSLNEVFIAKGTAPTTGGGRAAETYKDAGKDNLQITFQNYAVATHGVPKPGDFFTVSDNGDTLHTKLYKVTRVETPSDYEVALVDPNSNSNPSYTTSSSEAIRIHFTPGLQRKLYVDASLNFYDPKPRVFLSDDVQEYSLNNENLYSFSLKLEEAQK